MAPAPRPKPAGVLTPLELEIMQVLWHAEGPATVAAVQEKLSGNLAYTTVQTMLTVLLRKKKVRRTQTGRAFAYEAAVSRDKASGAAVSDLVTRMFAGDGEALLMALVNTRQITPAQIERAARLLKATGDEEDGQ